MENEDKPSENPPGQFEADSNPNPGSGQGQGSNVQEFPINDLPPEMLMEILKCVDTRSLLTLRLVNRQWNWISSRILTHRPDAQIRFKFTSRNTFKRRNGKRLEFGLRGKKLLHFVNCMKKCKNVPYAHFSFSISFHGDPTAFFDHPEFTKFLSYFSSSKSNQKRQIPNSNPNPNPRLQIRGLDLKFRGMDENRFDGITGKLADLLLNKTPHLENLSLDFGYCRNGPHVKLFPATQPKQKKKYADQIQLSLAVPVEPKSEFRFQLPRLKTLRVTTRRISNYLGILEDLLRAAVNLEKIYLQQTEIKFHPPVPVEHFELLQSLGKFELVKNLEVYLNRELVSNVASRPDLSRALFDLELEELCFNPLYSSYGYPQGTTFLSRLFQSQKDSLRKLTIKPLGKLTALQFPTFTNLTHLKLEESFLPRDVFFPPGVRALDIFPAVCELDLPENWSRAFPSVESIPILPNVRSLSVVDTGFTSKCISLLDLLCPNLLHLRIHKPKSCFLATPLNFLLVAPQIWTHMTQLESLEVDIKMTLFQDNCAELDSCFTGISPENCKRLYQLRKETRLVLVGDWKPESESESEAQLTAEKKHPSILDMKCLTKLRINPYEQMYDYWSKIDGKRFYTEKLTWVSQDYAFKLLPNLQTQTQVLNSSFISQFLILIRFHIYSH